MISQLELRSRAALCMQLAMLEPAYRVLWMSEAKNWSRLAKKDSAASPGKHQATDSDASSTPTKIRCPSVTGGFWVG